MSIHQKPRSASETVDFREALANMHLVYSNIKWGVVRFVHVAENALNDTPYEKRGWCFFESMVATVGSSVMTLQNGKPILASASPVPLVPQQFSERVRSMVFASPATDIDAVCSLYKKIFPVMAKTELLQVFAWGDEEARQLLDTLNQL